MFNTELCIYFLRENVIFVYFNARYQKTAESRATDLNHQYLLKLQIRALSEDQTQ